MPQLLLVRGIGRHRPRFCGVHGAVYLVVFVRQLGKMRIGLLERVDLLCFRREFLVQFMVGVGRMLRPFPVLCR
ncbi:hypothetical protein GALL_529830 [mine drainage metagenome]|uniref:Uncharacterized protein n=1 Tax=mine drainage metagenome TaxID=410659 RepID=A0A1J5P433_9ZZZZ